jgi:nicotinate-nucleotide pyrophosphorylase (carboxylating)
MPEPIDPSAYRALVREALAEDLGSGDVTTTAIVPPGARAEAVLLAKGHGVLAGLEVFREVFAQLDPHIEVSILTPDGAVCSPDERIATVEGPAAGIITGERTALNFLQYLSGIATRTRAFAEAAGGKLAVLDTRKTTPGLRHLAKYAVRCGGGVNHRVGLFDGVLIKDNHIRIAGGIAEAVRRVRATGTTLPIEVEAESLDEVAAAIDARVEIVMLDNLDDETSARAIALVAGRAKIELSGTMTVERVRRLAGLGADFVSIGAITHSAPALDLSLEVERLLSLA